MTAHGIRIDQLLNAPVALEPTLEPHTRVIPHRLASLLIVITLALVVVLGRGPIDAAARTVCTAGEPSGTSCTEALLRIGYP